MIDMEQHDQQRRINFEDAPFSSIHRKVRAGAYMGLLTDGYNLGIVGIALSVAVEPLGLTSFWMGMIGAGALFGILFGSLLIGPIADKIGRKPVYLGVMIAVIILTALQFFIQDPLALAAIRFLIGMSIGSDYTSSVALQSEWTPEKLRAQALGGLVLIWTVGYVIAFLAGIALERTGYTDYRLILCTAIIPATITLLLRLGMPESPGWLVSKGRNEEALQLVHTYLGAQYSLPKEEKVPTASWTLLFSKELRYNTMVSGIFFAAQVMPFFALSIFLPIVISGLNLENPHASTILYYVSTFVGVFIGIWLLGAISRRAFLLWTFYVAAGILAVMTIWQSMPSILALILLTAFALVLSICIVIEFAYPPELFPTEVRGSGVGLTIAMSRIGAAGGTFLLPIISDQFGVYASLWGCVGVLLFGGIVCHIWAPETSKKFMRADQPMKFGVPVPRAAVE